CRDGCSPRPTRTDSAANLPRLGQEPPPAMLVRKAGWEREQEKGERKMKRSVLAVTLAAAAGSPAFAQYVVIEPEVREYVIREAPVIAYEYEDYDGPVEVGAVLPADVEIFDIDDPAIDVDY